MQYSSPIGSTCSTTSKCLSVRICFFAITASAESSCQAMPGSQPAHISFVTNMAVGSLVVHQQSVLPAAVLSLAS